MCFCGVNSPGNGWIQMYEQYSSLDSIHPFVLSACFGGEAPKMNSIVKPATATQLSAERLES